MNARIAGLGWVTPLGAELAAVQSALKAGTVAETKVLENPETGRVHACRMVPSKLVESLARNPRLRRSSPISYFAVTAAQAALADANLALTPELAARTAIVFAVSNGGVVYTRRFYEQIVKQGANVASPMLFPETVYNAPASHLAAALGIDGATYTLVGDNSIGHVALHFAAQLLALGDCDRAIVVGCEEIDWIVCEAFHDWRLASTPLAEGAGAVVLANTGPLALQVAAGCAFTERRDATRALQQATSGLHGDLIISSANGTFVDAIEARVLPADIPRRFPKRSLGEAPGASGLWQTIAGALAIRDGEASSVLVPVVGFNQQAAALRISLS